MLNEQHANARILVVDDQEAVVESIQRTLHTAGYVNVRCTCEPQEVLPIFQNLHPDLLLMDLHMPVMDGFALLKQLKQRVDPGGYFPIIVLTGDEASESKRAALSEGAKDFLVKPCDRDELRLRVRNLLETRFLYLALQAHKQSLEDAVRQKTRDLEETQSEVAARLGIAAEFRDDETGQHTARVGRLAALIARNMGLSADEVAMIGQAAPLHDLGKIGLPDAILRKGDRLSPEEYEAMQAHTTIGARILGGSRCALLKLAQGIALYHHERWDGSGYARVKGSDIPLAARITAVADAFEVMTHEHRDHQALAVTEALSEIARLSGTQFDPAVVEAFLLTKPAELSLDLALIHPGQFGRMAGARPAARTILS